jgi:hypothetical protein
MQGEGPIPPNENMVDTPTATRLMDIEVSEDQRTA